MYRKNLEGLFPQYLRSRDNKCILDDIKLKQLDKLLCRWQALQRIFTLLHSTPPTALSHFDSLLRD